MNVENILKTDKKIPLKSKTLIHFLLVNNAVNAALNAALKPHGVSLQQFNVLRILRGQNEKPASLATLNERMVTKMSNTTRLVDKLLLKEYVERKVCPSNRRKIEIRITKKGLSILKKMDESMSKAEDQLLQNLSDQEMEQLNILFDKFK
ncbi:MarR family winged helix-turn-helix transcriptional regulator [Zobellia uliginosa]|uniref:MarR family winged helix-turn-helix transcriptional regulator n=1 Tax=Zobellia uliginosa TaxID=143224 RepID=UPI001C06B4B4|nr:MarR family transcriptional regulator [Zobellia uliginosa]MBU2947281.1 MarR family transcriptional regulator [Zobellia uliginosa]